MALNPTPAFDAVITRLKTFQPLPVYESEVPEDTELVVTNGLFQPFLVVYTGGPLRAARDHHLTGTRNDTTILYWTVEAYAPRAADATSIKGSIAPLLTGFVPPDCGELTLEGGMNYSRSSNQVRPTQFIAALGFTARSNLSWND